MRKILVLGSINIDHSYELEKIVRPGETVARTLEVSGCLIILTTGSVRATMSGSLRLALLEVGDAEDHEVDRGGDDDVHVGADYV